MGQSGRYGADNRHDGAGQSTDDCCGNCVLRARDYFAGADKMKVIFLAMISTTVVLILSAALMDYTT